MHFDAMLPPCWSRILAEGSFAKGPRSKVPGPAECAKRLNNQNRPPEWSQSNHKTGSKCGLKNGPKKTQKHLPKRKPKWGPFRNPSATKASPETSISPWRHPLRRPGSFKSSNRHPGCLPGLPQDPSGPPQDAEKEPQDAKKEPQDTSKRPPRGFCIQATRDIRSQAMVPHVPSPRALNPRSQARRNARSD